jgi:lipopolysaccharide transport system ATP-binding protein
MAPLAIHAAHLSKEYRIGGRGPRHDTLRDQIVDTVRALFRRRVPRSDQATLLRALNDVSFDIEQGETVGIIGRNGAGKSTLFKILSRITDPTAGTATIRGRLASLLEVGTGFHPELTGRENTYLNGAILGMRRTEIERKFHDIIAFAELERFVDVPVKRYSSGMYVRLAFAVAAHLDPDILLLDEVLSVGDLAFQRKCMTLTDRLRHSNKTILLVSHNMFAIKAMCTRVIYLSAGSIRLDGAPDDAIRLYEEDSRAPALPRRVDGRSGTAPPVTVTRMDLLDEQGRPRTVFDYGERVRVRLGIDATHPIASPSITVAFIRSDNIGSCNYTTATDDFPLPDLSEPVALELLTPPLKLVAEHYTLHVLVWDSGFQHLYATQVGPTFHVRHHLFSTHFGVFHESGEWSLLDADGCPAPSLPSRSLAP